MSGIFEAMQSHLHLCGSILNNEKESKLCVYTAVVFYLFLMCIWDNSYQTGIIFSYGVVPHWQTCPDWLYHIWFQSCWAYFMIFIFSVISQNLLFHITLNHIMSCFYTPFWFSRVISNWDCLIHIMGIPILLRWHLYIGMVTWGAISI